MTTTLTLGGVEWEVIENEDDLYIRYRAEMGRSDPRILYLTEWEGGKGWCMEFVADTPGGLIRWTHDWPTRAAALAAAEVVIPQIIKLLEVT